MTGLKDRQRLALYVALGLSAGSGLTLDASTAYANPDNDNIHVTVLSTDPDFSTKYASGVNATNETSSVKDNVVTIGRKSPVDTPAINGDVVGGYSDAYAVTHNTVTVDDMTLALAKSVFGGLADGDKAADDNEVTINGGTFDGSNAVYGGKSDTGTATNNTVTIAGGTFSNANVAGGAASTGTTSNHNRVVLGSDHGVYTADLSQTDLWGTRYSGDAVVASGNAAITGNTLTVNAQNVTVNKVRNFEKYQFNLNEGVAKNASMLTVNATDGFGTGANVQWDNIQLDANGWNGDTTDPDNTTTHNGKVGTVRLLKSRDGHQNFTIFSSSPLVRNRVSGDFEYALSTDGTFSGGAAQVSYIDANVNRIRNANTSYDGTTGAAGGEVYAGISELGNTAYNNRMTVTGVPNGGIPGAAYGGKVTGASGNAYANVLTITGTNEPNAPHAAQTITNAYGGAITNVSNAGTVGDQTGNANRITVTGGVVTNAYGGYSAGTGAVSGNTARIAGGQVTNAYGGAGTGNVQGNVAVLDGGSVGDIFGGNSTGGDAASNHVILRGGTAGNIYGAQTTSGNVSGNDVTITGGTVTGNVYAGGSTSGNVTDNTISLGDETVHNLSTATLGSAALYGANTTAGTASGNTLEVNAVAAAVSSVNAFNGYNFNIGDYVRAGDTMLSVANAGAFGTAASGVDWNTINVNNVQKLDRLSDVQGVERVTLLQGNTASGTPQLKLNNYASREVVFPSVNMIPWGDPKLTHEATLRTDNDTATANAIVLEYNRYQGGRLVHNTSVPSTVVTLTGGATELYGGVSHYANHPTVDNDLEIQSLAASITAAYGGKNESTSGDVQKNYLTITGTKDNGAVTHTIERVYGGAITDANNAGVVGGTRTVNGKPIEVGNSVKIADGVVHEVYGGFTAGTGAVQNNNVTIAGGTVGRPAGTPTTTMIAGKVYGGYSASTGDLQNNKVTITGGTIVGDGTTGGAVYGAYRNSTAVTGIMHGNAVELGDETGAYTADLTNVVLYGDNAATPTDNDNTLDVHAYGATVKSVKNFDNYKFDLHDHVTDSATMLTVNEGGFGKEIDWNKLTYENVPTLNEFTNRSGDPGGRVTLVKGGTGTDALKFTAASFTGHEVRDLRTVDTDPNTNVEVALSTDPSSAETQAVLLTYAKFRNNTWTYDGATSASANNEVFGGISYLKNDTTEKNKLTITGVPAAGLTAVYGGKTNGDANSKGNFVLVQGTDQYGSNSVVHSTIPNVYGGYTAANYRTETIGNKIVDKAGVAEGNTASISGGNVTSVYGGVAKGDKGKARSNKAIVVGGSVANVYGGAVDKENAAATLNTAQVSGGTVTGTIAGASAVYDTTAGATHTYSNANLVVLGKDNAARALPMDVALASIYGTDYRDPSAASPEQTFNGGSDQIKGNELNVTTTGVSAKKVRNFDEYHFTLGDDFQRGDTMLTITDGGFGDVSGTVTGTATPVRVDWRNVKAHAGQLSVEPGSGVHGHNENYITLMKLDTGATPPTDVLRFSHYEETKTAEVEGVYEKKVKPATGYTTSSPAGSSFETDLDTSAVMLELNRFRDDTVTFDGTVLPGNNNEIYGGYSAYDHTEKDKDGHDLIVGTTTENNILHIKQGVASGANLNAYGGYSSGTRGGSENNTVYVEVPATPGTPNVVTAVYGGYAKGAQAGAVRGNTVYMSGNSPATFTQGATLRDLMGGYIDSASTSEASGNAVFVEAGTIEHSIYGGYTTGSGAAKENKVIVTGGTIGVAGNGADVMAGRSASGAADNNYAVLSLSSGDSFTGNVTGGYGATATDNTVEILAGTLDGSVYGGYATTAGTPATMGASPTAEVSALRNNKVTLRDGVTVTGNVYGAYAAADASNMTAATDSNTIDLYKAVIDGTLYGGMARDGAVSGKNNTLAVHARGAKADDFVGVQNLHFYVPAGTTAADKETMLTLDNVAAPAGAAAATPTTKDLSHVNVGVQLAGNRPSLKVGDAVSLMKVYKDNTTDATHAVAITSDAPLVNKATGMQGISLRYGFDLLTREAEAGSGKNNELYATVTSASINPDTKSLVETRAASLAFLTSGSDLLTDAAMTAAMEVAATPASESQAGRARVDGAPKEYRMWAVQNVSSMRLNSGSHVDAKGWGLNLGFAKQRVSGRNTLTYGPFVEYGKGSYDSYLDDGLHGSGNMDYLGVGVMAKSQSENGAYVEGSVRVGRVKSDYAGTIDNTHTTYDSSSTYYAGHLGVGQEKQLKNGNTIDTYAKYFFTHQGGDTAKLSTGEVYDFDAADSHRIRFGTRYTSKKGDASFYTGLAYEYEFGNDIAASFEGYNTPSPSLTGGTGILELGYRFTPQNGRATYGIQLMGMTGKRRGISGGVQMHWAF